MKEKLYTIPMIDAVNAHTECPFCYLEKKLEMDYIEFVLGNSAAYMEQDIRTITDEKGFCANHYKKMFEYGNTLGNGWLLKTHYIKKMEELKVAFRENKLTEQKKKSLLFKKKIKENSITAFINHEQESCYICEQMKKDYERYLETFIQLYEKDEVFRKNVIESKGFCLHHFGDLCQTADSMMEGIELTSFYEKMEELVMRNMERMSEDISWLIEKYDYRNGDADWRESKDAVPRGMQKMKGNF